MIEDRGVLHYLVTVRSRDPKGELLRGEWYISDRFSAGSAAEALEIAQTKLNSCLELRVTIEQSTLVETYENEDGTFDDDI